MNRHTDTDRFGRALTPPDPATLDRALAATDRQDGQPALDPFGRALGVYVCARGLWSIRLPGGDLYWPTARPNHVVDGADGED